MKTISRGGTKVLVIFIDDYSEKNTIYFLKEKIMESLRCLKNTKLWEKQYLNTIIALYIPEQN